MGFSFTPSALTRPGTATAFPLRLRLHYKAARAGGVICVEVHSPEKSLLYADTIIVDIKW